MKPAPFDYALANSIEEATRYLADRDREALILAGGQTLMPMLFILKCGLPYDWPVAKKHYQIWMGKDIKKEAQ